MKHCAITEYTGVAHLGHDANQFTWLHIWLDVFAHTNTKHLLTSISYNVKWLGCNAWKLDYFGASSISYIIVVILVGWLVGRSTVSAFNANKIRTIDVSMLREVILMLIVILFSSCFFTLFFLCSSLLLYACLVCRWLIKLSNNNKKKLYCFVGMLFVIRCAYILYINISRFENHSTDISVDEMFDELTGRSV